MIGDELFKHLYTKYFIFQKTSEGSLVQFNGKNIFEYIRPNKVQQAMKKAVDGSKKLRNPKSCKYNVKNERDHYLNNVSQFYWDNIKSRTRIFYCTHFNRNNAFFKRHQLMKDIDTKSSSRKAEELFQSIFGFNRIRRDLRNNIINILTYLVDKVKTFNFNHYLAKSCPLPENWRERKTKILKYVDKSRDQKAKYYEELFSYTTDNDCVTQFINEFFYNCLPANFLKKRNRKNFQKKVKKFIGLNKHELIQKNMLLEKINTRDIEWMRPSCKKSVFQYFDKENQYVIWKLFQWIFEDVIVSLIRCFFYVTEQQKSYSKTYYYRKNVWDVIMKMSIADLEKDTLLPVKREEVNDWKTNLKFAPGKLRLIPKKSTFRPIMTFNKKIIELGRATKETTNTKLGKSHLMLKTLKNRMFGDPFGFAVFNYDDIMKKYEVFVEKWKTVGQPKLYFVTMDIEKCYDSVDREKLASFLKTTQLLSPDFYIMQVQMLKRKNNIVIDSNNHRRREMSHYFRSKWQQIALEGGQYPSLLKVLEQEQNEINAKKTLVVESRKRSNYKKDSLLKPVIDICKHNYIQFNRKFYKQKKGIPQGL